MPSLRHAALPIAGLVGLAAAGASWSSRVGAQAGAIVIDQYAETGAITVPTQLAGRGPAGWVAVVCGNGAWMRLRFSQLVLQNLDTLELTGSDGSYLRFAGNHWAGRTFFTRALAGACVTVRTVVRRRRQPVHDRCVSGRRRIDWQHADDHGRRR